MKFSDLVSAISNLSQDENLSFPKKCQSLQTSVDQLTRPDLFEHLRHAGIIPECFNHDSTEEKLFAKYCDALLARTLRELSLDAKAIAARADAADVEASGIGYKLVGDAKAFRLSRTAKNQKDFKVEALNEWRKGADYAILVAPLYQYPNKESQIYSQAARYNVVLLSYTHLLFMIEHKVKDGPLLHELWKVPKTVNAGKDAKAYWRAIDSHLMKVCNATEQQIAAAIELTYSDLHDQAKDQIDHLESEKTRVSTMAHKVLVVELIRALKLEAKISVIKKTTKQLTKEKPV